MRRGLHFDVASRDENHRSQTVILAKADLSPALLLRCVFRVSPSSAECL